MSDATPAPVKRPITPAGPVKASRLLWLISFAAGLLAVLILFLGRNAQATQLRELIGGLGPDLDADAVETIATIVFWGSLVALLLVIVIEAMIVRVMMHRHGWARWALLVVLMLHGAVAVLADAFVDALGGEGIYIRVLLVTQWALAGAAFIASCFPNAGAWFRTEKEAGTDALA